MTHSDAVGYIQRHCFPHSGQNLESLRFKFHSISPTPLLTFKSPPKLHVKLGLLLSSKTCFFPEFNLWSPQSLFFSLRPICTLPPGAYYESCGSLGLRAFLGCMNRARQKHQRSSTPQICPQPIKNKVLVINTLLTTSLGNSEPGSVLPLTFADRIELQLPSLVIGSLLHLLLIFLSSMPHVLLFYWCFLRLGFTTQINHLLSKPYPWGTQTKTIVFSWDFLKDEIKRSSVLMSMSGFSFQSL